MYEKYGNDSHQITEKKSRQNPEKNHIFLMVEQLQFTEYLNTLSSVSLEKSRDFPGMNNWHSVVYIPSSFFLK